HPDPRLPLLLELPEVHLEALAGTLDPERVVQSAPGRPRPHRAVRRARSAGGDPRPRSAGPRRWRLGHDLPGGDAGADRRARPVQAPPLALAARGGAPHPPPARRHPPDAGPGPAPPPAP